MSEIRLLRIADIDSERMRIRVFRGKGSKDRDVVLPGSLLGELRQYYKACRPIAVGITVFPTTPVGTGIARSLC